MSRFWLTTLLAIPIFLSIGYFMSGGQRMWAFTAFWTVYLTLVGCGVGFIQLQFFGPVTCSAPAAGAGKMRIALTFDDGPDPGVTPALLDLLKTENVPAAFFCVGRRVAANPELARRIATEGHLLANHTYNHGWWTPLLGARGLTEELSQTQGQISQATGVTPQYMRPPVGLTNPHYPRVLRRLGLTMIGWDVRSMDTRWSAEAVISRVLNKARDGSIILLHDAGSSPVRIEQIVGQIVKGLRAKGYQFVRLDELLQAVG